jgi:hypothetical protein
MSKLSEIEPNRLAGVTGGRASNSSQEPIRQALQSTGEAVKDLVRQQQNTSSSSSSMLPMMMMMMMKR